MDDAADLPCDGCGQCHDCRKRWFNGVIAYCVRLENGVLEMKRLNDAGQEARAAALLEAMVSDCRARQLGRQLEEAVMDRDTATAARQAGRLH